MIEYQAYIMTAYSLDDFQFFSYKTEKKKPNLSLEALCYKYLDKSLIT